MQRDESPVFSWEVTSLTRSKLQASTLVKKAKSDPVISRELCLMHASSVTGWSHVYQASSASMGAIVTYQGFAFEEGRERARGWKEGVKLFETRSTANTETWCDVQMRSFILQTKSFRFASVKRWKKIWLRGWGRQRLSESNEDILNYSNM